jgi:ABC-type transport system substrate-binding protein
MHKRVAGVIVLAICVLGWSTGGVGQEVTAPRGELRIVDKNPQNWAFIAWNIFGHLVEIDKDGELVPRLASSWRWLDDRTL